VVSVAGVRVVEFCTLSVVAQRQTDFIHADWYRIFVLQGISK